MSSPLLGQMFFRAASFGTFYHSVRYLSASSSSMQPMQLVSAGAFTGLVISAIETPIDLVKTKLQIEIFKVPPASSSSSPHSSSTSSSSSSSSSPRPAARMGFIRCASQIVRLYGVKGLWQGWAATAIRNVPVSSPSLSIHSTIQQPACSHMLSFPSDHLFFSYYYFKSFFADCPAVSDVCLS